VVPRTAAAPEAFACVCIDSGDGNIRLAVSGEVDVATAGQLDEALCMAQAGAWAVTLDLRRLQFIDCRGLAAVMAAADRASASGARFRVLRGPAAVDRLFSLTGFEHRCEMA
jgi:anti-sigma B factor antagonist